jgi:hypothetical protein
MATELTICVCSTMDVVSGNVRSSPLCKARESEIGQFEFSMDVENIIRLYISVPSFGFSECYNQRVVATYPS